MSHGQTVTVVGLPTASILTVPFLVLLDYGADISFRRWGRIVAILDGRSVSASVHRLIARVDRVVVTLLRAEAPERAKRLASTTTPQN